MQFPVKISFKVLAFGSQIYVADAHGRCIGYIHRKMMSLEPELAVYADDTMSRLIYLLKVESVADFVYAFEDEAGNALGRISFDHERKRFLIGVGTEPRFEIREERPWAAFVDSLVPTIPVVNALVGWFMKPKHLVTRHPGGRLAMQVVKHRTMMESEYWLHQLDALEGRECECVMLGAMIMIFRERLNSA
jgi:hypothetical protein